ncbi:MAG: hypothetical protein F6J90_22120 [Moorea sp. SIOASIH]|uniref:hypothetical protein n=1 Tax=Moorena sp. SIOASIH TaxID=2607817 RepID=UPI0013B97CA4|nr:hypothetical protein [Moorena sp. SIOASIH]NEO38887.1 hypothetical protein [Moorena sp. SIOASIH]
MVNALQLPWDFLPVEPRHSFGLTHTYFPSGFPEIPDSFGGGVRELQSYWGWLVV